MGRLDTFKHEGEVISPMTKDEARAATDQIKRGVKEIEGILLDVYERDGWDALGYKNMNQYMLKEFPKISKGALYRSLRAARTRKNLKEFPMGNSLPERVLRPIATNDFIEEPEAQAEIMQMAVDAADDGKPSATDVEDAKRIWKQKPEVEPRSTFNRTNDNIEWAMWSWNPVTGCENTCEYCYARDIANRFYPEKFAPTYRPERLAAPYNTKVPAPRWEGDTGYKNVFVCSMADLFGPWVPQKWIDDILLTIFGAPMWNFLFLTKFPKRMMDIEWPDNAWVGTTVDIQARVSPAEEAFESIAAPVKFLSCEPLQERLTFTSLSMFDWVIIGARSKNSNLPAFQPEWSWVQRLDDQAVEVGCKRYWKPNLTVRPREYPE